MPRYTYAVERGGVELRVSFSATPSDPGRLSGPPERCYPPEPPEFDLETIEMPFQIPDDLSPDAKARRLVWIDITDLLLEVGDDFADRLADELLDNLADEDVGPEPEDDDLPFDEPPYNDD